MIYKEDLLNMNPEALKRLLDDKEKELEVVKSVYEKISSVQKSQEEWKDSPLKEEYFSLLEEIAKKFNRVMEIAPPLIQDSDLCPEEFFGKAIYNMKECWDDQSVWNSSSLC